MDPNQQPDPSMMQGAPQEAPMAPEAPAVPEEDASPFGVYEKLRGTILELLKQGLPGADQLLLSIDKIQAKNITEAITEQGGQAGVNSPQAGGQYGQSPQA